jgi:hypothetical protein
MNNIVNATFCDHLPLVFLVIWDGRAGRKQQLPAILRRCEVKPVFERTEGLPQAEGVIYGA